MSTELRAGICASFRENSHFFLLSSWAWHIEARFLLQLCEALSRTFGTIDFANVWRADRKIVFCRWARMRNFDIAESVSLYLKFVRKNRFFAKILARFRTISTFCVNARVPNSPIPLTPNFLADCVISRGRSKVGIRHKFEFCIFFHEWTARLFRIFELKMDALVVFEFFLFGFLSSRKCHALCEMGVASGLFGLQSWAQLGPGVPRFGPVVLVSEHERNCGLLSVTRFGFVVPMVSDQSRASSLCLHGLPS